MRRFASADSELPGWVLHGWDIFTELCPSDVADAVLHLVDEPEGLTAALEPAGTTLLHADYWTRNLALAPDRVVVLDWSLATQGPPVVEFAIFLAASAWQLGPSHDDLVAQFLHAEGTDAATACLDIGLLAGISEMGWNMAFHAATNDDAAIRARERQRLDWWVSRARTGLEALPHA
jgi:aminoglycoside phosphotransferase (APT) family kinase protein